MDLDKQRTGPEHTQGQQTSVEEGVPKKKIAIWRGAGTLLKRLVSSGRKTGKKVWGWLESRLKQLWSWFFLKHEELIVALLVFAVVWLYLQGVDFASPLLGAVIVGVLIRLRVFMKLRMINGPYLESGRNDGEFDVKFKWWNIFQIRPVITINFASQDRGAWTSKIYISDLTPLRGSGSFEYTEAGKHGGQLGDWGTHDIHISPGKEEIHVSATALGRVGQNLYTIRKQPRSYSPRWLSGS